MLAGSGPFDYVVRHLAAAGTPRVRLYRSDRNLGFAAVSTS